MHLVFSIHVTRYSTKVLNVQNQDDILQKILQLCKKKEYQMSQSPYIQV